MTIGTLSSGSTGRGFFDRARGDLASLRSHADSLYGQLSTGNRLNASSDDPIAASRLRLLARNERFARTDADNVGQASQTLKLTDDALGSLADIIGRAKELVTRAASATLDGQQRASIATELTGLRDSVLTLANTRDATGAALFGGSVAGQAYTLDGSGNAVYAGGDRPAELPLADGQQITPGVTGPQALSFAKGGTRTDLMAVLKTLADGIQQGAPDPAGAARDGLDALDAGLQTVTTQQTVIGARMNWLDLVTQRAASASEQRTQEQADVGGVDTAGAIMDLQRAMLVLETSQASFAKLSGLSLMSQLN